MSWNIKPWNPTEEWSDTYEVRDAENRVAVIIKDGDRNDVWEVHFIHRDEYDFEDMSLDVCVGYVRGIERVEALQQAVR